MVLSVFVVWVTFHVSCPFCYLLSNLSLLFPAIGGWLCGRYVNAAFMLFGQLDVAMMTVMTPNGWLSVEDGGSGHCVRSCCHVNIICRWCTLAATRWPLVIVWRWANAGGLFVFVFFSTYSPHHISYWLWRWLVGQVNKDMLPVSTLLVIVWRSANAGGLLVFVFSPSILHTTSLTDCGGG